MSKDKKNKQEKQKRDILMSRREVLKAAGYAVTGGVLGVNGILTSSCMDVETKEKATGEKQKIFLESIGQGNGSPPDVDPFPTLFTPLKIGTFEVRNRILSTGHQTGLGLNGGPSEASGRYWVSKAKGGIGLIGTEVQLVSGTFGIPGSIMCQHPDTPAAFRPIVKEINDNGARLVAQLWHPGKAYGGPTAPSAVRPDTRFMQVAMPRAMTIDEIKTIIQDYAKSAIAMREGNLDGIEVHMAHNYLPEQFMSPLDNIREDEYGGSEEKRLRFPIEVLQEIRKAVGDDYTVGIRMAADEFEEGGLTLEDMKRIAPILVEAGKLDFINVSLGPGGWIIPPMGMEHGLYVYLADGIKEVVNDVPIFCIGRIVDPIMAESIVAEGRADMVGMTRANIADPELPNKAREGRSNEIRICCGFKYCWDHVGSVTCAINPSAGNEKELAITPADTTKKVMVIGAGAAGMEAARVAAERGHTVSLYEQGNRLGGQLVIASQAPLRNEAAQVIPFYSSQFSRLNVDVHLNTKVDKKLIEEENPEVVIVATGGLPMALDVPGGDGSNVVQARDVLMGEVETGDRVVLVGGENGLEAITTASFLGKAGKYVESLYPAAAQVIGASTQRFTSQKQEEWGVIKRINTTVKEIQGSTVVILEEGQERTIEDVDTVVIAMGSYSNNAMIDIAQSVVSEVHAVGQCQEVTDLHGSVLSALSTVREI